MHQWTTPDAYAGDVHDPMSQKPYMWNGNNPVQYSDPSGYEANGPGLQGAAYDCKCTFTSDSLKLEVNLAAFIVPGGDEVQAGRVAVAGATEFLAKRGITELSGPSANQMARAAEAVTQKGGLGKFIASQVKALDQHMDKIKVAESAGGFTSQMLVTVKNVTNLIKAAVEQASKPR